MTAFLRRSLIALGFAPSFLLAQSSSTGSFSVSAKLFTVHIDEVALKFASRFEELNAAQMHVRTEILQEHNISVIPAYSFGSTEGKYFFLRPKKSYSEIDNPPAFPDDVRKLMNERYNPYSDTIHLFLNFHHNEIWLLDTAACYLPRGFDLNKARSLFVRMERTIPERDTQYDSATTLFRKALGKVNIPIACLTFFSNYGTGANIYVFQARSGGDLQSIKDRQQILINAYGDKEGIRIFQMWNKSAERYEEFSAQAKLELTDLSPTMPWMGIISK